MSVSALPGENKTNQILYFCLKEHYYLIKIIHKTYFPHFCHLGWKFIQLSVFQLPAVKNVWSVRPLRDHRHRDGFSFRWQQWQWCSAPEQSATLLHDSVIDWLLGDTGPKIWNLFVFLFILTNMSLVLAFPGNAKADTGWGKNKNGRLVGNCVKNVCTKNN